VRELVDDGLLEGNFACALLQFSSLTATAARAAMRAWRSCCGSRWSSSSAITIVIVPPVIPSHHRQMPQRRAPVALPARFWFEPL
jgi:RES domain-containing protein